MKSEILASWKTVECCLRKPNYSGGRMWFWWIKEFNLWATAHSRSLLTVLKRTMGLWEPGSESGLQYIYVIPTCSYIFKKRIVVLLLIPFISPILICVFLKMSMPVSPYYITHIHLSELPMRTNICQTHWRKEWIQIRDYCTLLGEPNVFRWTWQTQQLFGRIFIPGKTDSSQGGHYLVLRYPAVTKRYCSPK
jgi:hypothetical protein